MAALARARAIREEDIAACERIGANGAQLLSQHAGLRTMEAERLREPSTKFTLRSFVVVAD